eukprot:TRINITY_DN10273_c0_g3_i2.p2 TRINITY_DN10273_c0_g3~~TRINITY_DN10273_c0_g3_i2.p2  ORF type:complete len:473 (-),score=119.73 TRINITY_DN10273_c0_g3_i2:37-1455(-)
MANEKLARSMINAEPVNNDRRGDEEYIEDKFKDLKNRIDRMKEKPGNETAETIDELKNRGKQEHDMEVRLSLLENSLKMHIEEKMQEIASKMQRQGLEHEKKMVQSEVQQNEVKLQIDVQRKDIRELLSSNKELRSRVDALDECKSDQRSGNKECVMKLEDSIRRVKEMCEEKWKLLEDKAQVQSNMIEEIKTMKDKLKENTESVKGSIVEDIKKLKTNQDAVNKYMRNMHKAKLSEFNKMAKQVSQYEQLCTDLKKEVEQLKTNIKQHKSQSEGEDTRCNVKKSDIEDLNRRVQGNIGKIKKLEADFSNKEQADIKIQTMESNFNNSLIVVNSLKEDVKELKIEVIDLKYKAKECEIKLNNTNATNKIKELKERVLELEEKFIDHKLTTNNELLKFSRNNRQKSETVEDAKARPLFPSNSKAIASVEHELDSNIKAGGHPFCSKSLKFAEQLRLDLSVLKKPETKPNFQYN